MPGMLAAALLASLTAHAADDRVPSPERAPTVREPSDRHSRDPLRSPELTVELGAGVVAGHVGVGGAVEASRGHDHFLQLRGEAGLYSRHVLVEAPPLDPASRLPPAAVVGAELALTPRFGRSRIGPAVAVDTLFANWREQECTDFYGCRFNNDMGWSTTVVAPNPALGLRWGRRAAPGQGFDLGFGLQPFWSYDMGLAVPRVDLDVFLGNGWTFGVETSRYEALLQVGRAL